MWKLAGLGWLGARLRWARNTMRPPPPPPLTASVLVPPTLWDAHVLPDLRRAERLWTWWVEKDGWKWWNHLQRMWVASFPLQETLRMERKPPPCVQIKESCRGSQAFGHPKARAQWYYCDLKYLNVWVGWWWWSGRRIYFCSVLFWFLSCKQRCIISLITCFCWHAENSNKDNT